MCQSRYIGLDSLYRNEWRKISMSCSVSSFKWIGPLFFELSCTETQTQARETDIHTDKHEYSIVAVDKPQL